MISVTDLRAGTTFKDGNDLFQVLSYEHIKMGRGSANIKVKTRNITSGAVVDKSFMNGAVVEDITLENKQLQFLYKDSNNASFMNITTFEQQEIPIKNLVSHEFLIDGKEYMIQFYKDTALGIILPPKITLKVDDTAPNIKGNSASNVYKDAVLENGMNVRVPLFINSGDLIVVDTRDGSYTKRA